MEQGHLQAYFDADVVLASSPGLDAEPLRGALPGGDGLRVSVVEGVGLVAARRVEEFTHVVAGVERPIELIGWQENPGAFAALTTHAVDLAFLADAPPGVATRLLDAALAGPVVFFEPDADRRERWIAWLSYALPVGDRLTFSTAGDEDVRVRATDDPADAIDTTELCELTPSFYARVALALAERGALREAAARLEEADGVALAVYGGATDLLAPHQLPLALQLITELATSGHVREAARAAAGLGSEPGTALVLREPIPLPEVLEPEPVEEILDAEVVEPDVDAWSNLLSELKSKSVMPDANLPDLGLSLDAFAASLRGAPEPEDEVIKEEEVGMSLAELEETLKREGEP